MLIIGRSIPLFDILRRRIGTPDVLDGCSDGSFNGNLHGEFSSLNAAKV